jgi:hypothetical protein
MWAEEILADPADRIKECTRAIIFYSCKQKEHTFGVGFLVNNCLKHSVIDLTRFHLDCASLGWQEFF